MGIGAQGGNTINPPGLIKEPMVEDPLYLIESTPQSPGAEVFEHPLAGGARCVVGTAEQLTSEERRLAIGFAIDVYRLSGYMNDGGDDILEASDIQQMATELGSDVPQDKKVQHVLLFGGGGQIQAYVRMVPTSGNPEERFDSSTYPTGRLFSKIEFGFEESEPDLTNDQVRELSRLTGASVFHRSARRLISDTVRGNCDPIVEEEVMRVLKKYLSEDEYRNYQESIAEARTTGKVPRHNIVKRTQGRKAKVQRQFQMMLFMLAIDGHLKDTNIIKLIGNLDPEVAGVFLSSQGGIAVETGSGVIDWESPDITKVFEPYMRAHEDKVTPFHFGTEDAITNASGRAGTIMRKAQPFLSKTVIGESLSTSP